MLEAFYKISLSSHFLKGQERQLPVRSKSCQLTAYRYSRFGAIPIHIVATNDDFSMSRVLLNLCKLNTIHTIQITLTKKVY